MDFKQFYKEIIFDIDNHMNTLYSAKQGDTKSRGFYVTLTQNNIVVPVTTQTMTFYAEKPDGTRVFQNAIKDGDKFRIDISNQVFATKGIVKCELALRGSNGEKISSKTFKMMIEEQLADDSIISEDEITIIDNALAIASKYESEWITIRGEVDVNNTTLDNKINNTKTTLDTRIDNIIATPTTVSEQEIIDARQGEASLGANLMAFKEDYATFKTHGKNIVNVAEFVDGRQLASDGKEVSSSTNQLSPYIRVEPNTIYTQNSTLTMGFYDENKELISVEFVASPLATHNTFITTENTRYIRVNNIIGRAIQVEKGDIFTGLERYKEKIPLLEIDTNNLDGVVKGKIEEWKKLLEVEYVEQLFKGYALGTLSPTGNFNSGGTTIVSSTEFIPINPANNYVFGTRSYPDPRNCFVKIAYYDASKKFISISDFVSYTRGSYTNLPIVENTGYVKFSISEYAKEHFFSNVGDAPVKDGETKVFYSGFADLIPDKVIEENNLSDHLLELINSKEPSEPSEPTVVQKQKPFPEKFNFETVTVDHLKVSHLSRDGKVIYATRVTRVLQSLDEGETWENVTDGNPTGMNAFAVRDLDDGELLITTRRNSSTGIKSKIYKTRGYDRYDLTGITLDEVLEVKSSDAEFNDDWCLEVHANIVVANEYGLQGLNGARYAFLSTDYGETWKEIFDQNITTQSIEGAPTYTSNAHLHTIHYDRYSKRIWLAVGDQENCATYYSDDMGDSWKAVKESTGMYAIQYTGITSYPEGVLFGSDRSPDGVYCWKRTDNPEDDVYIEPYFLNNRAEYRTLVYGRPFRRYAEKDEVTFFSALRDGAVDGQMGSVIVGLKGFKGSAELIDFTEDYPNLGAINSCVGVTVEGNVLVSVRNSITGEYEMLRAKAPLWE